MDGAHHNHHLAMNASRQQDATAPAHRSQSQRYPLPRDPYYLGQGINASAISASVQRYIHTQSPPSNSPLASNTNTAGSSSQIFSNAYIPLPPGVDPASVDFRTFYPYNPSEVKHRKRTTRGQLKLLEETFKRETKPNAALRKTLAAQLEMTPRGVQVWFQNRS
ncbi:hypothetical protein SCHPADRAFT_575813 [Schizopora paradoxa]|uniref:Homeobox domain-containing protein n=1 Tax=Schizopora paradoxa TaxID=27342 RepID=A0A0H2RCL1_9AGAM|nr:hypothetical protein SCHPADRAFT_575813 [Schizopora paradoxa]